MFEFSDNNNKQMPNYQNILYPCTTNWNKLGVSESPFGKLKYAPQLNQKRECENAFSFEEST